MVDTNIVIAVVPGVNESSCRVQECVCVCVCVWVQLCLRSVQRSVNGFCLLWQSPSPSVLPCSTSCSNGHLRAHTHTHTHTHARSEQVTSTPPFHTHWLQSQVHFQTILINVWVNQCVIQRVSFEAENRIVNVTWILIKTHVYFWSFTDAVMKSGPLLFNPRPSSERFIISQMREIHCNETTDENETELRWDLNLMKNHENTSNTHELSSDKKLADRFYNTKK